MAKTLKYTEEKVISDSLKLVRKGILWGIIDGNKNEVCHPKYHEINDFNKSIAKVRLNNLWGFIDITGHEICEPKYEVVCDFHQGCAKVSLNGFWGFIDILGRQICEIKYREVFDFSFGLAIVRNYELNEVGRVYENTSRYGCIDIHGTEKIPLTFNNIDRIDECLLLSSPTRDGNICILLDKDCNTIIGMERGYRSISIINDDRFIVSRYGSSGVINKNCQTIVLFTDSDIKYENGILRSSLYRRDIQQTFTNHFDLEGNSLGYIGEISDSLRRVKMENNKFGYLDIEGKLQLSYVFDFATDFINGKAIVKRDDKVFFINKMGEKLEELNNYDRIKNFVRGFAVVKNNNLYGFIDSNGKEICELKFDKVEPFCDGIAKVTYNGYYGFINESGLPITDFKYYHIENFVRGFAKVEHYHSDGNKVYGMINKKGMEVIPTEYSHVWEFDGGIAKIQNCEGKIGYIGLNGLVKIPCIYTHIEKFKDGKAVAQLDKEWFYIDMNGNRLQEKIENYFDVSDDNPPYGDAFDGFSDAYWNVD